MHQYQVDVLIVGSGGAGLRAALEIVKREPKARVILTTKGQLGKSGVTASACSDRMAFHATLPFTEPGGKDNWRYHANDIYRMGGYVSDEDLAQILAKNSRESFEYLDRLGVPWVRTGEWPDQFLTDGSQHARACYTGPHTANHIEEALVKKIETTPVKVLEDLMVVDLMLSPSKDRVIGAFGVNRKDEVVLLRARATILATGGAGGAFKDNMYPEGLTGDGYAMAYRAGAELVNMEFIQMGLASVTTRLACSGSMMRAIPLCMNDEGEEFLPRYFPPNRPLSEVHLTIFQKGSSWPVSYEHKSHLVDLAVYRELKNGRKVYLDYNRNSSGLEWGKLKEVIDWYKRTKRIDLLEEKGAGNSPLLRLQTINQEVVSWLKERGVDLMRGDRIEIAPAVQHFQGGVRIRQRAQTTLKGLYAAGECAGGQHGASRPGGNALLDCQVFGKIAGLNALEEAKNTKVSYRIGSVDTNKIRDSLRNLQDKSRGENASLVRTRIQDLLSDYVSIVRTEKGLSEGIEQLREIERKGIHADDNGPVFALETLNLLTVAQVIMGAAEMRRESRGPHLFFCSFNDLRPQPRNDKSWQKYIVIRKSEGNIKFEIRKPSQCSSRIRASMQS